MGRVARRKSEGMPNEALDDSLREEVASSLADQRWKLSLIYSSEPTRQRVISYSAFRLKTKEL